MHFSSLSLVHRHSNRNVLIPFGVRYIAWQFSTIEQRTMVKSYTRWQLRLEISLMEFNALKNTLTVTFQSGYIERTTINNNRSSVIRFVSSLSVQFVFSHRTENADIECAKVSTYHALALCSHWLNEYFTNSYLDGRSTRSTNLIWVALIFLAKIFSQIEGENVRGRWKKNIEEKVLMHPFVGRTTIFPFRHDPPTIWHANSAMSFQQCMPFILVDLIFNSQLSSIMQSHHRVLRWPNIHYINAHCQ